MTRSIFLALIVIGMIGAIAFLRDELPRWTLTGTHAIGHDPLSPVGPPAFVVPLGAIIVCDGDSITRGSYRWSTERHGFPEYLAAVLGKQVRVVNRGTGGATAADGLRGLEVSEGTALAIVMYGTNDADPRSFLTARRPVPLDLYRRDLRGIVNRYRDAGAQVLVLAPPPGGSRHIERRIAPYRHAARDAAIGGGAAFLDPVTAWAGIASPLYRDGLHPRPEAQQALAHWLAEHIDISTALIRPVEN